MTLLQRSQTIPQEYRTPTVVRGPPFPFMNLPIELRWIVYNYHIIDYCTITPTQIHESILPRRCRPLPPPLSLVCKSIQREMRDEFRRLKAVPIIRLSWQDKQLDELTKLHLHSLQIRPILDFDDLRIHVYAPHPDRPCDLLKIMRNTLRLCRELKRYHVQHLTVTFVDTEIADWTREPDPIRLDYYESGADRTRKGCSFMHVLNLLAGQLRAEDLRFIVPPSLVGDSELEMMALYRPYRTNAELLATVWREQEATLKVRTGKNSWKRFNQLIGREWRNMLWAHELEEFQAVWPHMETWPCNVPENLWEQWAPSLNAYKYVRLSYVVS
ncbi:hypothetical protein MMC15_001244 [Xylographa vitiligo]|nr:hypothetical protein [Xylographa vitiligo]